MKAQSSGYSFLILRYVHDVVSSEFVNIGVVVYSPDLRFLGARCTSTYSRITKFFGRIDGASYRSLVRYIQEAVELASEHYCAGLMLGDMPSSIESIAATILPPDDSALQFSPKAGGGITSDPEKTLQRLYERYVEIHVDRPERQRADDEQILSIFKAPLREKKVLSLLRTKRIETPDFAHEFPLAWKNGVWNVCEPISFDLAEGPSIRDKATHLVGRALALNEAAVEFKMFLLVGKPSNPDLWEDFSSAESILRKTPVSHEIIRDDRAWSFADRVQEELRDHPQIWQS